MDWSIATRRSSYALQYGRDLNRGKADRFVGMYVNDWTLDFGPRGREAVQAAAWPAAMPAGVHPEPGRAGVCRLNIATSTDARGIRSRNRPADANTPHDPRDRKATPGAG